MEKFRNQEAEIVLLWHSLEYSLEVLLNFPKKNSERHDAKCLASAVLSNHRVREMSCSTGTV
jgi:hypothetical protein